MSPSRKATPSGLGRRGCGWTRWLEENILPTSRKALLSSLQRVADLPPDNQQGGYLEALKAAGPPSPSEECGFHAVLPFSWVIHLHSLPAILMAHRMETQRESFLSWLSGEWAEPIHWVPEMAPGATLSRYLASHSHFPVYLLKNHGLILQCDTPPQARASLLARWRTLEVKFCRRERGFIL